MSNPGLICAQNERNVVRDRRGSVLSRGLVLKVDQRQHPSQQEHLAGMLNLQGAPCFRAAEGGLGVYGLAQPTIFGIKTLLSLLHCRPNAGDAGKELMHCVWVCTREEPVIYVGDRPFVLREAHKPKESLNLSDRAENLESIEKRLKMDILAEAERWNGLLLVHEEHASTGELVPTWVAVQDQDVRTMREVWKSIQDDGWRVQYKRLPIARDQPLEHNYLDAYTQVIKGVDPRNTCFVTNCGAGVWRTTFAMIAAVIVRRRQLMLRTHHDPFDEEPDASQESIQNERSILLRAPNSGLAHSMRQMQDSMAQNQSLLRLVNVLTESLSMRDTRAAIAELVAQPVLLESLRQANSGGYNIILQLCGLLDEGRECKSIVDMAIDSCQDMINIRESILENRLCYSTAAMDEEQAQSHLARAGKSLEVYYFLIAFASYVQQSRTAVFEHRFVDWLKHRVEIWRGIQRIRTLHQHLSLFDPVADLSDISKNDAGNLAARTAAISKRFGEVAGQGAQVTGDEFSHFVVHNRSGTVLHSGLLLKRDVWREFFEVGPQTAVSGVVNFRRVPETNVFGTGQPSVDGIHNLLNSVLRQMAPSPDSLQVVTWINLREEPLVYVRGKPYCLRRRELSLRNLKNYSGITPERLLLLENRLRQDVIAELKNSDGKLLLHTETEDGTVVPLWEDASPDDIATVQQVMDTISNSLPGDVQLVFRRIPITAEKTLELPDVMDLLSTILDAYQETSPIIVNCQLGRGRTTLVSVYILLIERWIQCVRSGSDRCLLLPLPGSAPNGEDRSQRQSYHVTNSLLRVIPHGQEVKRVVDDCIDQCSTILNLRRTIEDARLAALDAQSDAERNRHINSGIRSLQRYAHLLLFQAYLQTIKPETMLSNTFERFVKRQPVLATISKDLDKMDIATITPLRKMDPGDGMALRDEVDEVVQNRSGDILGAQTILKSDFFSGILKAGLPLHVEGMPNLRGVSPLVELGAMTEPPSHNDLPTAHETWGCGMPTVEGLRRGLARMGAGPNGHERTVWTNLREEPVLYVNGRPHVLRLADQPLTNVEATGVTTDVVERIERTLKRDLIKEALQHGGRVLLHDEVQTEQGDFETIPLWETVKEEHILTPREVYELVQSEGFRVNYARVAITDEQAPVPQVFSQIEDRVQTAINSKAMTVFNCQMGRGRTTSGMIIAALIVSIDHYGNHMLENQALLRSTKTSALDDEQTVREEDLLMQGEYRCILQLVGVLSNGTLAKALTDRVIDRMETIQNLRKAILLMKLRADNAEPDSARQKQMRHVYHNYLARYGYLIAFAAYLIDRLQAQQLYDRDDDGASSSGTRTPSRQRRSSSVTDHDHPNPMSLSMSMSMSYTPLHDRDYPSFRQWLEKRREIRGVLKRAVQE
ncbi:hypothetical protein MYAM1_000844 [Malassezia yamatoensis]|uniref:Inositol hexakisphosphate-domain-containing protein n=1 Tax=Malassezia yamatoensis TaxID=253288 RepID=A0AAJ5YSS9_9BASI|nr:hypothetical protein MYAM1_000844 [Malassezia yamatoensis]